MLQCGLVCLIGFVFFSMLYTMSVGKNNKVFKILTTLNEDQKKKYREIAAKDLIYISRDYF